jgi:hypothetical protein
MILRALPVLVVLAAAPASQPPCLKDRGPCEPKERLSRCTGAPDAPLIDEEDAPARVGQRVAVRGHLAPGPRAVTTMMACAAGTCCNHVHAWMMADRWLALRDSSKPERFTCDGDESMVCCPLETAREAVVVGKIVALPSGRVLEVESICHVR